MKLIHSLPEINYVKIIGELMPNLQNSKMVTTSIKWTTDQLRHGDSGIGNSHNVEDGHSGDTSTPTTTVESGLGLTVNPNQTVEPFEIFLFEKCMPS